MATVVLFDSRTIDGVADRLRLRRAALLLGAVLILISTLGGTQQEPLQPAPSSQNIQRSRDTLEAERKRQIAADSAALLRMAIDLKSEVDKTTKETLSIPVIRKAGEIEKLARTVKDRERPAGSPN